jgi:hypothetical protein
MNKKFIITAVGISLFILILILLLSPNKSANPAGSAQQNDSQATSTLSSLVPLNLSKEKKDALIAYTNSIKDKLPLSIDSFMTSVGIETFINITHLKDDPAEVVYLNIGGISYIGKNELNETKNPNITAFKESYLKAIELLEGQNIDPKRLVFVYSDVPYVRETANYWVDNLGLLK